MSCIHRFSLWQSFQFELAELFSGNEINKTMPGFDLMQCVTDFLDERVFTIFKKRKKICVVTSQSACVKIGDAT